MELEFSPFRFCSEERLLYKNGELVPLTQNQASLLFLLLSSPEHIHSKGAILDEVWGNKVVSEQAVFQTISQLRSLLGNDAIKTFSKRGYKWNIPLETPEVLQLSTRSRNLWLTGGILLSALILIIYLLLPSPNTLSLTGLHNQQDPDSFSQDLKSSLREQGFELSLMPLNTSLEQAFATPVQMWKEANMNPQTWLLWGKQYNSAQTYYFRYGLAYHKRYWRGYVFANSKAQLETQLARRLKQLRDMGILHPSADALSFSKLVELNEKYPQDNEVKIALSAQYINIDQLDVAHALLDQILNQAPSAQNLPARARAYWMVGKIYKLRAHHQQAESSLDAMAQALRGSPLWPLSFEQVKTQALLAYRKGDYSGMDKALESGLALAQQQADPLSRFELHILVAVLSQRSGQASRAHQHLNHAQSLLLNKQLNKSNQVFVNYLMALLSKGEPDIGQLQQTLSLPRTAQNNWVLDHALELTLEHFLSQKDFAQAHALFAQTAQRPNEILLHARVYLAEGNAQRALPLLKAAFDEARIAHDQRTGIDSALLLYKTSQNPAKRAQYLLYLESNADPHWLEQQSLASR